MRPSGDHAFHPDTNIDFQLSRLVADGDAGLVEAVRRVAPRIRDFDDWTREFLALADDAEAAGRVDHAARYVRAAAFFMNARDPRQLASYQRFRVLFDRAWGEQLVRHEVEWRDARLPVIELPSKASAPTILVHGGFDSFIEEFVPWLTLFAGDYRVVAFEGPGQGAVKIEQGVPMTADWSGPTSAVIDALGLDDLTLIGISLGGCLALRAAADESRIRRVVAYDVMYDFFECVTTRRGAALARFVSLLLAARGDRVVDAAFRLLMRRDLLVRWGVHQGMEVTGTSSPSGFLRASMAYTTRDVSPRVRQDVLLLAGSEDHFVPVSQLTRQRDALISARSVTTRLFTVADSAASHCQMGNLPLVARTIRGFIEDRS